jgi:GDP-D-mannose dehydratase
MMPFPLAVDLDRKTGVRDIGTALTGRVALVTGASGGIGTALVTRLLAEGARVVATTRRPDSPRLAALCAEHPGRLRIVQADMGRMLPGTFAANAMTPGAPCAVYVLISSDSPPILRFSAPIKP